jgi:hypothetical protein
VHLIDGFSDFALLGAENSVGGGCGPGGCQASCSKGLGAQPPARYRITFLGMHVHISLCVRVCAVLTTFILRS